MTARCTTSPIGKPSNPPPTTAASLPPDAATRVAQEAQARSFCHPEPGEPTEPVEPAQRLQITPRVAARRHHEPQLAICARDSLAADMRRSKPDLWSFTPAMSSDAALWPPWSGAARPSPGTR